jgi:hypothetical protein
VGQLSGCPLAKAPTTGLFFLTEKYALKCKRKWEWSRTRNYKIKDQSRPE